MVGWESAFRRKIDIPEKGEEKGEEEKEECDMWTDVCTTTGTSISLSVNSRVLDFFPLLSSSSFSYKAGVLEIFSSG